MRFPTTILAITLLCCSQANAQSNSAPRLPGLTDNMILAMLQSMPPASAQSIGALINGVLSDTTSHMRMAERRAGTVEDTIRAKAVVHSMHSSLMQYTDVAIAERDGFVRFLPWLEDQAVYHFNNSRNARIAATRFDATKPTSLLYRKDSNGKLVLVGGMYTAPANSTLSELDARLPLGIAYWHQHVNFCARQPTPAEIKALRPDSARVARSLQLDTPEACAAEGGWFLPQLFGWMAHVNAFESDDLATIWGEEGKDHMAMHHHSP